MLSVVVGIILLLSGTGAVLVGLTLVVAEILSGRHRQGPPIAQAYAGLDWTGIGAVLTALAKVLEALKDWPLPALIILLGIALDVIAVVTMAGRWF